MASLPGPESRDVQEMIRHHLKWSHAEKQLARQAFEPALDREFRNVIRRTKDMAKEIGRLRLFHHREPDTQS